MIELSTYISEPVGGSQIISYEFSCLLINETYVIRLLFNSRDIKFDGNLLISVMINGIEVNLSVFKKNTISTESAREIWNLLYNTLGDYVV